MCKVFGIVEYENGLIATRDVSNLYDYDGIGREL